MQFPSWSDILEAIYTRDQRWTRIRIGSDWIRTEAYFGRIRTGSDCNFLDRKTGSDWENILCFNVIILNVSKILVLIRFYRYAKWQCNFAINDKSSAGTILPFLLNTNISSRTHGPYHRHKSKKGGLLYIIAHYWNRVCTRPTLGGVKHFILTTAVSSFTRAQKMDSHTVAHHTTGVSTCPTLREAKHFPNTSYFSFYAWCVHSVHIFLLHQNNTDET